MNLKNTLTILTVLMSTSYAQDGHHEMQMQSHHNQQETYRFEGIIMGDSFFDGEEGIALMIKKFPSGVDTGIHKGSMARVPDELFPSADFKVRGTRVFFNKLHRISGKHEIFYSLAKDGDTVRFERSKRGTEASQPVTPDLNAID